MWNVLHRSSLDRNISINMLVSIKAIFFYVTEWIFSLRYIKEAVGFNLEIIFESNWINLLVQLVNISSPYNVQHHIATHNTFSDQFYLAKYRKC